MPAAPLTDFSRLCLHTITTKPWSLDQACENYSRAGVKGISVWRDPQDMESFLVAYEYADLAAADRLHFVHPSI